jgi:catechol 2,3-dioxygenase-like lactoylglutathione lyase family enzyme
MVSVRYIVDDVEAAIGFYGRLGFEVAMHPAPGFAALRRGDLRLLLNTPGGPGGAAQPALDGRVPEPGGWNRIQLELEDLDGAVASLREAGATFRTDVVTGRGGRQALVDDPAGNCVELFTPSESSATTS